MGGGAGSHASCCTAHSARHATAFIGATAACLGAFLTMRHLMPTAFIAASLTDVCAQLADHPCHLASPCHVTGCHSTYGGTVDVERDASCHRFYILLLQAGSCTVIACSCAVITCFDTGFELSMCHNTLHSKVVGSGSRAPVFFGRCALPCGEAFASEDASGFRHLPDRTRGMRCRQ